MLFVLIVLLLVASVFVLLMKKLQDVLIIREGAFSSVLQ